MSCAARVACRFFNTHTFFRAHTLYFVPFTAVGGSKVPEISSARGEQECACKKLRGHFGCTRQYVSSLPSPPRSPLLLSFLLLHAQLCPAAKSKIIDMTMEQFSHAKILPLQQMSSTRQNAHRSQRDAFGRQLRISIRVQQRQVCQK